jgi:hypothetical protein
MIYAVASVAAIVIGLGLAWLKPWIDDHGEWDK